MNTLNYSFRYLSNRRGNTLARFVSLSLGLFVALLIFAELKAEPDQSRLEQEMIFYIEKLDINEEKVRLRQHCNYFLDTLNNEQNPGKKLGFIAQEMGREINTTGSKANHTEIQKIVVKMKDELEKIKEQSLNIL